MHKRKIVVWAVWACCFVSGLIGTLTESRPVQAAQAHILLAEKGNIRVYAVEEEGDFACTFTRDALLQGGLMYVSADNPLPEDFKAPPARGVKKVVGQYLPVSDDTALADDALQALCDMQRDHPLEHVLFTRGALSCAQQEAFRRQVFAEYAEVYPLEEAMRLSRQQVPAGGQSEHQLARAVDVELTGTLNLGREDPLLRNETGMWLHENMWKYGFIRRYADGGAGCEGIHLRHVGVCHAAAMNAGNWDLETYLTLLAENGSITVYMDGEAYAVFCLPYDGGDTVQALLPSANAQGSLDNLGHVILWCKTEDLSLL